MIRKYENEDEIFALVKAFEEATVAREAWHHAEHLTVALFYLNHFEMETATDKVRNGILKLLTDGFGVDLSKDMPYHETLTVFWMKTVAEFDALKNGSSFLDKANELIANYEKDYPLQFYSREYLFSDEARTNFVNGDL